MKKYIEHLHTKDTHERRAHAMRWAFGVTAALFFVWITTLGVRLSSQAPVVNDDGSAQIANVLGATYTPNTLEVVDQY